MKLNGTKIEGPNVEILVLPRGDGRPDLVLKARAVLSYKEFDALCPRPTPPMVMLPGGEKRADFDDATYKSLVGSYAEKRHAWMIYKSLEATEGLEWEQMDLGNPNTWLKLEDELEDSGFNYVEIMRIRQLAMTANCLNDERLEEARKSFLASQRQPFVRLSFQKDEQNGTQSGEPARDSASDPQEPSQAGTSATSGFKGA